MSRILDFIKPGVVTGNDVQKIFQIAKQNKFALPAINCINLDSINAVLESACNMRSPIIIQFSNTGAAFIIGKGFKSSKLQESSILGAIVGANYVHFMASKYNIPVILHTDHCTKQSLPWIDGLLDAGEEFYKKTGKPLFSSHMIDLSMESLNDNIEICSKYLTRMSKIDMTLEIELGCTGGEEDGIDNTNIDSSKLYSNPKDINYAYEQLSNISNNFTIAALFGNVHGVYKLGNVKLMPSILRDAQNLVIKKNNLYLSNNPLNFVFHGGSGSSLKEMQEAIDYGVIKVNIDTDIQWAAWYGVSKYYKKNKKYLQSQLGNPEGINQPNKKYYDPRIWLRYSQLSVIESLKSYFYKCHAVNVL
ncbi:MAG: class II fructose-bisphosphate aldolase [Pantoea sp. Brub]|nr:class II fructose-bisphosphate aldolase [Pantoea sp. Brub]